jgi:hypothetical protein
LRHVNVLLPQPPHSCKCRIFSVAFTKLAPPTSSQRQHFFLRVVGEVSFYAIAVARALLIEQDRRGRAETCAQ